MILNASSLKSELFHHNAAVCLIVPTCIMYGLGGVNQWPDGVFWEIQGKGEQGVVSMN